MNRFHSLVVAGIERPTRDAIVVTFDVPPAQAALFRYRQGQHLTLRTAIDGEEVRRSYSICAAEQERRLRVAIKRVPDGVFSTWANECLRPGMTLDALPPEGSFGIVPAAPEAQGRHYLAFAAGSGITPILSILKTRLLAEPGSRFTLLYGNRASSSVLFREELASLKDQYLTRLNLVYVMSRERQDIDLFNGRITQDKCRELFGRWLRIEDADLAFVCGPEPMMHGVAAALREAGMATERIRIELFAAAAAPGVPRRERPPSKAGHARTDVTVVMDGSHAGFAMERDRESVLDAGLRAGLDLRWSCKGGVCSTCRCKVVEGAVDMDVNYALEDYEVARGYVLACQSYPVTDRLVLDFDAAD